MAVSSSRIIRRIALALAAALLAAGLLSGCAPGVSASVVTTHMYDKYVENATALDVYYRFIYSLDSAEIEKRVTEGNDLFGRLSSTVETIKFSRDGDSVRLLYRERTPAVFFYYPEYEYYDGENYYYKLDGNWFVDPASRRSRQLTPDFLGIPTEIFSNYDVTFNALYKDSGEYILKIQGRRQDTGMLCDITGYADDRLNISRIEIIEEYSVGGKERQKRTLISYSNVNGDVEIEPPKSLNIPDVNYLN